MTIYGHPGSLLPPPPFALLIGKRNVEALVIDVIKRPAGRGTECPGYRKTGQGCALIEVGFLLVVVDEEALHDENVEPIVVLISLWRQADAVGTGELDWVLLPAFDSADHGFHVQGSDH